MMEMNRKAQKHSYAEISLMKININPSKDCINHDDKEN
jgi:hypothetical protein